MKRNFLLMLLLTLLPLAGWADGVTTVDALKQAFTEASDGATITLGADINLGDPQDAVNRLELNLGDKAVTLDLGDNTLSGRINLRSGKLTVTNGKIEATNQPLNVYGSNVSTAENYSVLTVADDVEITVLGTGTSTDDQSNGVCMMSSQTGGVWDKVCYGAVINFYGTVKHADNAVDMTSGLVFVHGWIIGSSANNVVNIKSDSKIISKNAGVALNGIATVNVEDGATITGYTGIAVKRGTLNVTGGTITATGTTVPDPQPFTNGTEMTGAAVSLTSTYSNQGPISVNIAGGKFASTADGSKSLFINSGAYTQIPTVSIIGGRFTTPLSVGTLGQNFNNKFIVGGKFAGDQTPTPVPGVAESATNYLAPGAIIDQTTGEVSKTDIGQKVEGKPVFAVNITDKTYVYDGTTHLPNIEVGKIDPTVPVSDGIYTFDGAPLVEGRDYVIVWTSNNPNYFINAGEKKFNVVGKGGYEGSIVDEFYTITGKKINVNIAQCVKTYGNPDPTYAKVERDASTPMVDGENFDDIRKAFLFERESDEGETAENVGPHKYVVHVDPDFPLNYEVSVLQNYGYLYIDKAELTIEATPATRKFNEAEPTAFGYVVNDALKAQLPDWDIPKATGKQGDGIIATITRAAGNAVNEDPGYAFTATAANYNVTVSNKYTITPATDISGLRISFKNTPFKYTGVAQEPEFEVTDNNGALKLIAGTDYTNITYGDETHDNTNAGSKAGIVKITLAGAYVSYPAKTITQEFEIQKVDLALQAKSYGVVHGEPFTEFVMADANKWFVNSESIESETMREYTVGEGASAVTKKYLKLPTITKTATSETGVYTLVVGNDGEARNYNIIPRNGIYAPGYTPVVVTPNNQRQTYGDAEITPLTVTAVVDDDNNEPTVLDNVDFLFIGGRPVYNIAREGAGTTAGRNVGTYDITLSGPTILKGYAVTYNDNEDGYEIVRRQIFMQADNKSKTYGSPDPTFTATIKPALTEGGQTVGGLAYDDTREGIGLGENVNGTAYYVGCGQWYNNKWNHEENVGEYDITVRFPWNNPNGIFGNYQVITEKGTLTINKRVLSINADPKTKAYGAADPELTATVRDANNNTVEQSQEIRGLYNLAIGKNSENKSGSGTSALPGTYPIEVTLVGSENGIPRSNYTLTTNNSTLTINKAQVVIKANDQWIDYGQAIDVHNVTIYAYDPEKDADDYTEGDIILQWTRTTSEGISDEEAINNGKIADMVTLSVLNGKKHVGANMDAYDYTFTTNNFYEDVKPAFINGYLTVYPLEYIPLDQEELVALTNNQDVVLKQVLEDHKGLTVDVSLPAREMKADEWYAWVLPFAIKPSLLFDREYGFGYGAAEVLDDTKSQGTKVVFALKMTEIPANTPFIAKIEGTEAEDANHNTIVNGLTAEQVKSIRFYNVTIDDALDYVNEKPATGTNPNVQFVGLYEDLTGPTETMKFLAATKKHPHNEFWQGGKKTEGITLVRTNAFLDYDTEANARAAEIFIEELDGTYTAIGGVKAETEDTEGIYNLSGIKLNAAPTQKGIYIQNGKKVLVK